MKFLRPLLYIIVIFMFAAFISYAINSTTIRLLNSSTKTLTQENISSLSQGDIVEFEGTIDYLHLLSDNSNDEHTIYFAGIKEYPNQLIVKFKSNKLSFDKQIFKGKVELLSNTNIADDLISKLNSSIDLNSERNKDAVTQFNGEEKEEIIKTSVGNFSKDSSVLVLDEVLVDRNSIFLNVFVTFGVVTIFLFTLFRNKILRFEV